MIIIKNLNDNLSYSCRVIPDFFGRLVDAYDIGNNRILKSNEIRIIGINEIDSPTIDAESKTTVKNGGLTVGRDEMGRFTRGHKYAKGGSVSKRDELAKLMEEVLENKHYKRKDGTYVLAKELVAEAMIDELVNTRDSKIFTAIMERIYGKARQDIGFNGAITHKGLTDEEKEKVRRIFKKFEG